MKKRVWKIAFAIAALVMAAGFNRMDAKAAAGGTSFDDAIEVTFGEEYSKSYSKYSSDYQKTEYFDGVFYKFSVPSSGLINYSGSQSNALGDFEWIYLYDGNKKQIEYFDQEDKKATLHSMYLITGDYYFQFKYNRDNNNEITHEFTLMYTNTKETIKESQATKDSKAVNNDSIAKASTISLGESYVGQLGQNDTTDCHKFVIESSGRVSFDISLKMKGIKYALCDESGNEMDTLTKTNEAGADYITKTADLTKGTYYMVLNVYSYNTTIIGTNMVYYYGTYSFDTKFISAEESFVETGVGTNNSINTASEIKLDTKYTGQIAMNDADDYYKVTVPTEGILEINGTSSSLANVKVTLFSADGTKLTDKNYSINTAGVNNFVLERECTSGTYYVDISKTNSDTGNYTFSVKVKPIPVSSIELNVYRELRMTAGKSDTLTATVSPKNATNKNVTWSSSDETIATVDEKGTITAKKEGTATITATAADGSKVSTSCTVTVKEIKVSKITLDKTSMDLLLEKSDSLKATIAPDDAFNKTLTWTSSDASIATVDEKGAITAKKAGTATITATAADGSKVSASCTVTVKPADGWVTENGVTYWYEKGVKQGTTDRGKEIFDEASNAWYWLDAIQGGAKTVSKDVYQESDAGIFADNPDGTGKWVRYDAQGHMIKGWNEKDGEKYYFDSFYGAMVKSSIILDGINYNFNHETGALVSQQEVNAANDLTGWLTIDGKDFWYENGVRQGVFGRGKEIFDPGSDAWYWLDAVDDGKKAVSKDVYQESLAGDWGDKESTNEKGEKIRIGKWVRYDAEGHMIKGWSTDGKYYFDKTYGTMAKGQVTIDGQSYEFDEGSGVLK